MYLDLLINNFFYITLDPRGHRGNEQPHYLSSRCNKLQCMLQSFCTLKGIPENILNLTTGMFLKVLTLL